MNKEFHTGSNPVLIVRITFLTTILTVSVEPFLMARTGYAGYGFTMTIILAVYSAGSWISFMLITPGESHGSGFLHFYAHGWKRLAPPVLIATTYLLFYDHIITDMEQIGILLFALSNIAFILSIIFPFFRQSRMSRGHSSKFNLTMVEVPDPLKFRLETVNTVKPLLYVRKLNGLRIANASQVGITQPVIVMTDFLFENMESSELSAILGHEMGHFVDHDAMVSMIIFTVPLFVSLDFLFYTVISPSLFSMVLTVLFMIFAVFDIMVIFPYTRKMAEINADRYVGVTLGMASEMIEALETLMALNARPREYWSLSSRTHPSIDLRIRKLRNYTG